MNTITATLPTTTCQYADGWHNEIDLVPLVEVPEPVFKPYDAAADIQRITANKLRLEVKALERLEDEAIAKEEAAAEARDAKEAERLAKEDEANRERESEEAAFRSWAESVCAVIAFNSAPECDSRGVPLPRVRYQPTLRIHSDMRLHPKIPLVALARLMHLGIPFAKCPLRTYSRSASASILLVRRDRRVLEGGGDSLHHGFVSGRYCGQIR